MTDRKIKAGDLVTYHELPLDRQHRHTLRTKVAPEQVSTSIATVSPMGRAMLGRSVGDQFDVDTPAGTKSITITDIGTKRKATAAGRRREAAAGDRYRSDTDS